MDDWQSKSKKEADRILVEQLAPRLSASHDQRTGFTSELLLQYAKPYATTLTWFELLDTQDPLPTHHLLVRRALQREGIENPNAGDVALLAATLIKALRALRSSLDLRPDSFTVDEILTPPQEDGMFCLDARAARFLETQSDAKEGSQKIAQWIRTNAKERYENYRSAYQLATPFARMACTSSLWSLFCNDKLEQEGLPSFAVGILVARALWGDLRKEEKSPESKAPEKPSQSSEAPPKNELTTSLPSWETVATLHLDVAKTYSRMYQLGQLEISQDQKNFLKGGEIVAEVATMEKKYLKPLQRKLLLLGNLSFRRAVNYLTRACWARYQANEARPDILAFDGLKHFAEAIGETSCESQAHLLETLSLGQAFSLSWPGGVIGGLWTFQYTRPAPGRASWLEIRLSSVLEPHFGMGKLDSPWRVPIVKLPPMIGRFNDHGAQAAFAERLLIEMVERRLELYREGGAKLDKAALRRLSDEVGLSTDLSKLLDRWERNDEEGDAFLERKGDLIILADTPSYRSARGFLLEAGRRSIESKEAAKRGILIQQQRRKIKGGANPPSPPAPRNKN